MEERKGPPCDCFSGSVIDERRHAMWCPRRLWTERNDTRADVERLREALHVIANMTHQDIDPPVSYASWWPLISEVHNTARKGLGDA